jgi:hypothetical protein
MRSVKLTLLTLIIPMEAHILGLFRRSIFGERRDAATEPNTPPIPGTTYWFDDRYESVYGIDLGGLVTLSLGEVLSNGESSKVFAIPDRNWVIKYKVDCESDTIGHEWHVMGLLGKQIPGITPDVVYVSDRFSLPAGSGGKVPHSHRCRSRVTPQVRFLISVRAGISLWELGQQRGRFSIIEAAKFGLEIMRHVSKIHDFRIVHGDIHPGNIVLSPGDDTRVMMIDWAMSRVIPSDTPVSKLSESLWCQPWSSPWEMTHHERHSFRTDMFRVLLVMAYLVHGDSLVGDFTRMCESGSRLQTLGIKQTKNIFDFRLVDTELGLRREYTLETTEGIGSVKSLSRLRGLTSRLFQLTREPESNVIETRDSEILRIMTEIANL